MPCRDGGPPSRTDEEADRITAIVKELKKRFGVTVPVDLDDHNHAIVERGTPPLCAALRKLGQAKVRRLKLETQMWWRDHQRQDAQHKREEAAAKKQRALAKRALAKLTPAEREALKEMLR